VVSGASLAAEVRVVIAVHGGHRAAELSAVAERARAVVSAGRLFCALGTGATALLALVGVRTVEIGER